MGPIPTFLNDLWNALTLEVVWDLLQVASVLVPPLVAILLVFVSRVVRRLPPIGVWIALAAIPMLGAPSTSAGLSLSAAVFSGIGWTHALFRLHRFGLPSSGSRAIATLGLAVGVFALGIGTTPIRVGFGFASMGVVLALFPMLEPRIGPPSRLRRAVPVVVSTYVLLVMAGIFATIAQGSPEGHYPMPPHGLDLPSDELWWIATWQPLLIAASLLLVAGLATCRTRRELVATALATGAVLIGVLALLLPERAVLVERWETRTADIPLAPDGLTPDPFFPGSRALPPETPIDELLPAIAKGELKIQAHKLRPGTHLGLGTLRLLPHCSHAPNAERIEPVGTLGDVIDQCHSTRCVVAIPPAPDHDAEEARAQRLLDELTQLTTWHSDEVTDHEEAARLSLQLRALVHTHATSRTYASRVWEVPWEWAGKPFETGDLDWVEPTAFPDAELHLIDHHQPDGFAAHTMALNHMPRTIGRMTTWSRVPRRAESWVTGPQAVDPSLPPYIPDFLVVVQDGMVIDVRTSAPDPALIREWLDLETTPRPRLDQAEHLLEASDCETVPPATPGPNGCAKQILTCDDRVVDRLTVDDANAFPTAFYEKRERSLQGSYSLDGADRGWIVDVPANTVARVDFHTACGTINNVLFSGVPDNWKSCVQNAEHASSMDYPWRPGFTEGFVWMKTGRHMIVVETSITPAAYELEVTCSQAIPGSGVDTGMPAGLY